MTDTLKHLLARLTLKAGAEHGGTKFSKSENELLRQIDIDSVIAAHIDWKNRIAAYLAGNSLEYFRSDIVALDHRCALGKWLQSVKDTSLGQSPVIQQLATEHQNFHFHASHVVGYKHAGKLSEAQKVHDEGFEVRSHRVLDLLHQLK
jgi:hypothetical protein